MKTTWNEDGLCRFHGLTPEEDGGCASCKIRELASKPAPSQIELAWAKDTTSRMSPGGDLFRGRKS